MYFMVLAFFEILINVSLTVIKPKSVLYSDTWSMGDFIQICLAAVLGLTALAFFIF
jgi:hypothetical protein